MSILTLAKKRSYRQIGFKQRLIDRQGLALRKLINEAYRKVLLEVAASFGVRLTKAAGDFNVNEFQEFFSRDLLGLVGDVYGKNLINRDTRSSFGVTQDTRDELTAQYIQQQQLTLSEIGNKETQLIQNRVANLVGEGLSQTEIRNELSSTFKILSRSRSKGIARNLVSQAYSTSRVDFWEEVLPDEEKTKEWLPSIGGMFDRRNHNQIPRLNGIIAFDQLFHWFTPLGTPVSGRFPNDPLLPPGESINCACDFAIGFRNVLINKMAQQTELLMLSA